MDNISRHPEHPSGPGRIGVGLIGAGAFGAFAISHLRRFFDIVVHDPRPDLASLCAGWGVTPVALADAAARRVVIVAVPLSALRGVARGMAPHLRPNALVVDVCSVKLRPLAILHEELPAGTTVAGTHPLFGPVSGRHGIAGLTIVVCRESAGRASPVERFLRLRLGLRVVASTAEAHDREMAYVQALSHLVAHGLKALAMPDLDLKTAGFVQLEGLMTLLGDDSMALFATIAGGNPFASAVLARFIDEASDLVARVTCDGAG